jgi:uncharacterized protein YecT (DUF1311 family)
VGVAIVIVGAVAILLLRPATKVSASVATTTTVPCSSRQLTTDYQIDQCLESKIQAKTTQMDSLLRDESVYFHYASTVQDWRVARRTQSTFVSYAREECLAEANPYQPGTIVPILYGECVIGMYDQRVVYLHHAIASFKNGGEAQGTT